jgi:hypothetical protein
LFEQEDKNIEIVNNNKYFKYFTFIL